MNRIVSTALALILLGGSAAAERRTLYQLYCNGGAHGVVRGGPWARVAGPFHDDRDCEKAMPGHRGAAHGGDIGVVLRCARIQ
jgi:hypothetical protein